MNRKQHKEGKEMNLQHYYNLIKKESTKTLENCLKYPSSCNRQIHVRIIKHELIKRGVFLGTIY